MGEIERLRITKSQYRLLNQIRGLHEDAFHMVVCAAEVPSGHVLRDKSLFA